ncbi:helix-turn-helix domain-containing protein [Faucicola boevrei]|uniref:helix-turn-helix domain-containing protein n=1 Tax=Faucicola boevrei TaxID=346665 RepID=UPI00036204C9|nr:helix-turn-helix domain-containing protein [Moraxella boevrei]
MSASSQTAKPPQQTVTLSTHIELVVRQYFRNLGNETPSDLYDIMLQQLEKPLLKVVLEQTRGNQSKTAEILGLNRGTLRKKLKTHGLD